MLKRFFLPVLFVFALLYWAAASAKANVTLHPHTQIPVSGMVKLTTGAHHACAITTAGGVKCWGDNDYGQLGNGGTASSGTSIDVVGLDGGVAAVSAGKGHTCALTTAGGVKCWGGNDYGQLGDGGTANSGTPVDIVGLERGAVAIGAGWYHTCAVTTAGGLVCWGNNDYGQLGTGNTTASSTPVDVMQLGSGVAAVSAGREHTCALLLTGGVQCWGGNAAGQLGNGDTTDSSLPVDVIRLGGSATALSAGGWHTCVLAAAGGIKCWGWNYSGQLGNGAAADSNTPSDVIGLGGSMAALSASSWHTCALTVEGGAKCWGYNYQGQLGNGGMIDSGTPVDVAGLSSGATAVGAGNGHTCALLKAGGLKCWGGNEAGQLGNGATAQSTTPVAVVGLEESAAKISAGGEHTCALIQSGHLKCWGLNNYGQLGNDSTVNSSAAADLGSLDSAVSAVSAGYKHTCAVTTAGGIKCWGDNDHGQVGNSTGGKAPVEVMGLGGGMAAVSAGGDHTCALTKAGGVKCWGWNQYGQLGNGGMADSYTPVDVTGLGSGVTAIAAGYGSTCALTTTGGIKCWGLNDNGQLGDGTTLTRQTPADVVGLSSGATAVDVGYGHACVLTATNGVRCWGGNQVGQLGNGNTINSSTPVDVLGLESGVTALSVGAYHACVLTATGEVKCWGRNGFGQLLGAGNKTNSNVPVAAAGLSGEVTALSAGIYHTCILTAAGDVKCRGSNYYGQLGDGNAWKTTPVEVLVELLDRAVYLPVIAR